MFEMSRSQESKKERMNDHDESKNDEEKRKLTAIKKERENRDVYIITSTLADLFDSQNKYMYPTTTESCRVFR